MTSVSDEKQKEPEHTPEKKGSRSHTLLWCTLGLLLLGLLWFLYWFLYLQYYESTDDAYANGNMVNINSAIPGSIVAFYADNTDLVKEGQLIVELDCTEYKVAYEQEIANLASVVLQVRQLYDNVLVNQSNVENKKTLFSRASYDYENRLHLVDSQAISNEDFIHSKDAMLSAQLDLKAAENQLKVAIDAAGNTPKEKHPLIEQQKAKVRAAYYNVNHCSIYAPATGYVAQRSVQVGQRVSTGQNLMAVIPSDYVWVDANFKETQLPYMRIGQPARVWFDLYGSKVEYKGKVLGIASGTGSVFSIIPPQNATGNWIKIVQRLPVRISLDPEQLKKYPSRLGISADVEVDITNQNLPMLAETPSTKPVSKTNVFDISFKEVDDLINKVLKENLNEL